MRRREAAESIGGDHVRRDVVLERVYPYSPERIWHILTDPAVVARWLAPSDFRAEVGHCFQCQTPAVPGVDSSVTCRVTEVAPHHRLAYTWEGTAMCHQTAVRFTLQPVPGGTHLRLEHTGFQGLRDVTISLVLGRRWRHLLRPRLVGLLAGLE
jgi:uncharacterized protein YndB with AHSA1/START domain